MGYIALAEILLLSQAPRAEVQEPAPPRASQDRRRPRLPHRRPLGLRHLRPRSLAAGADRPPAVEEGVALSRLRLRRPIVIPAKAGIHRPQATLSGPSPPTPSPVGCRSRSTASSRRRGSGSLATTLSPLAEAIRPRGLPSSVLRRPFPAPEPAFIRHEDTIPCWGIAEPPSGCRRPPFFIRARAPGPAPRRPRLPASSRYHHAPPAHVLASPARPCRPCPLADPVRYGYHHRAVRPVLVVEMILRGRAGGRYPVPRV